MAQIAEPISAPARSPYLTSETIAFIVMVVVLADRALLHLSAFR